MNLENLKNATLSDALELYAQAIKSDDQAAIKSIRQHIGQNHSITNYSRLQAALSDVEELDSNLFTKEMKQELIGVKLCAFEIAEHLDPQIINNFGQLETMISTLLSHARRANEVSSLMIETTQGYAEKFHNPH